MMMVPILLVSALLPLLPALGPMFAQGCTLDKITDLSHELSENSSYSYYPFIPGNLTEYSVDDVNFHSGHFCMGDHTGTHVDAPYYLKESEMTVAKIPLETLIANALFLNVSGEVADNADFILDDSHIDKFISSLSSVPENAVLLICYGWAKHYGSEKYLGTPLHGTASERKYPGMSEAAANKIAGISTLVGVGTDTPSVDLPNKMKAHAIFAAKNFYTIEQIDFDRAPCLPDSGFTLITLPLKLASGTAASVRLVATPKSVCKL